MPLRKLLRLPSHPGSEIWKENLTTFPSEQKAFGDLKGKAMLRGELGDF